MNHDEAMQHGLGYAAGREDASGVRTAEVPGDPQMRSGFLAFAQAYAQGWDDFNSGARCSMTNARDAYDRWQESGGRTIWRRGDLTLSEEDRRELDRLRPGAFASTEEFAAYWNLRDRMQDDAWHALFTPETTEMR